MRLLKLTICGFLIALLSSTAWTQNNELHWTMESAIKQLDRQGSDLDSVLSDAKITWEGPKTSGDQLQSGRAYFNSRGELRISPTEAGSPTVIMDDRTLYYHDSAANKVREYSLSKHKSRLEPFLPIGFTITGKDMEDDFLVTFIGEDAMGDRRVLGLEMTPKKDDVRAVVSRITVWFDESSWLPAKQVIEKAGAAGTLTIEYSGTARNLDLNPDLFSDRWPRGTEEQRM